MKTKLFFLAAFFCFTTCTQAQWVQTSGTPPGGGITSMVVCQNGNIVVTCASYNFPNGQSGGIRYSTNGGSTWTSHTSHYTARTLAIGQNGYVWASSWNYPSETEALYRLSSNGTVFEGNTYHVGAGNNIFSILATNNNQTLFIGTRTGVMKSTNGGFNFTSSSNGINSSAWVLDLDIDASGGFIAAGTTHGAYITTNSGSNWNPVSGISVNDTISSLKFRHVSSDIPGDKLLSASNNGSIYKSDWESEFMAASVIYTFFG